MIVNYIGLVLFSIMSKSILITDREPGISFILRCRNEENYLAQSIESLKDIKVPFEIIVILHLCTDSSRQIAEGFRKKGFPIRIYEYSHEVSRAGYETLITPDKHQASLVNYYNFCMSKAKFNWLFKWDADFQATPSLIDKLNEIDIESKEPQRVYIYCLLGDVWHRENYLFNSLLHYKKYVFWEVPIFKDGTKKKYMSGGYIKSVPVSVTKGYWNNQPWFMRNESYDKGLVSKYRFVEIIGGREVKGMARASNKNARKPFYAVLRKKKLLKKAGINITS